MIETSAFVGGGNMSRAIVLGMLAKGADASRIRISEPMAERRRMLAAEMPGVRIEADNVTAASGADTLVLAVKPQLMEPVCAGLATLVQAEKPLVVSIAAGTRVADIDAWLGGGVAIVRAMPNQPALLGLGVSGLFANALAEGSGLERAEHILASAGRTVRVNSEADIDAVTAVSGSGPAYFFLLIDMLTHAGETFGLERSTAATLALETARGAAAVAADGEEDMATLIARVRSPGGTTAAALDSLENDQVRAIFERALTAARDRATELAGGPLQGSA